MVVTSITTIIKGGSEMKLKDLLVLYDGHGTICINDDNLNCITKGNLWNPKLYDLEYYEVVVFGFYDNELCVRVRENK